MTLPTDPEAESGAESAVIRIQSSIAKEFNGLPNLSSQMEEGDGRIKINPRFSFPPYDVTPRIVEGDEYKPVAGDFLEQHNEIGHQVVRRACILMRQELGEDNFFGSNNTPEEVLNGKGGLYGGTAQLINELYTNHDIRALIGTNSDGSRLWTGDDTSKSAANKGIPQPISEALLMALASNIGRTVEQKVSQEAAVIDGKQEAIKKEGFERRIQHLENGQIPSQEAEVAKASSKAQNAQLRHSEAGTKAQSFYAARERINKFIYDKAGHLPAERVKEAYDAFLSGTPLLIETGSIFTKKVVVSEAGKEGINRVISQLLGNTGEISEDTAKLGVPALTEVLVRAVEHHLKANYRYRERSSVDLFNQARNTIEAVVPLEQRARISQAMQKQQELIIKMARKNPGQAKDFATTLLSQTTVLHLLQEGLDHQKKSPSDLADPLKHYNTFMQEVNAILHESAPFKEAKEEAERAKNSKEEADKKLSSQESSLSSLRYDLQGTKRELEQLSWGKDKRITDLKTAMLGKILETSAGVTPREQSLQYYHPAGLFSVIIHSRLFTDAAGALFTGLPHFVANDNRHPSAAENVAIRGFTSHRLTEEQVQKLDDFLPETVAALLPEDHPTKELAVQFISDMLRRYSGSDHVQASAGYGYPEDITAADNLKGQVHQLLGEIAKGGRIIEIPDSVPRIDLEHVRSLNQDNQGEAAQEVIKTAYLGLIEFIQKQGLETYKVASGYILEHPAELAKTYGGYLTCDKKSLEKGGDQADRGIVFYDQPPYNKPHYAVEIKTAA